MIQRYFLNRIILLSVIFLLVSCNSNKSKENLISVQIGVTNYIGEISTFVAKEKGYFEEEGLDVEIKINIAGVESMKQLLAGEVDIAHSTETPFLHAILDSTYYKGERKGNPQAFANMILANRNQKIVASRLNGEINQPLDIKGKKVGMVKKTQSEYHFDSFLLENQISQDEVEIIYMKPGEINKAIRNGEIDVAVIWEPHATHIIHDMKDKAYEIKIDLTHSSLWLAVSLDSYAKEKPEILVAYLKALRKAQSYVLKNPEETIDKLAKLTNTPKVVIKSIRDEFDYVLNLNERMLILLEWHQYWVIEKENLQVRLVHIGDFINYKPMEEAHPRGVTTNK